ncbi:GNAT family N-acetyltransferase, partial [Acidithiobacillus sp. MC2.1]|nr:GNAT family N-acetyltransferase [Acidithiobacillus sp. MC2.2]
MPPAYRPRFFAGLVAYQTTQLQQAMGYSQEVAHDLAYHQIQGVQQDDAGLTHRHLVAAKWKKNIIGGAWYMAVPERASSLLWIMIEDAHRGQGHGRRLLAHVAE